MTGAETSRAKAHELLNLSTGWYVYDCVFDENGQVWYKTARKDN